MRSLSPFLRGRDDQAAFTLMELMITVSLIAVLAAILLPVAISALGRARETPCMENLRQLYVVLSLYREDHAQTTPAGLFELVPTYAPREILLCPEDRYGGYANRRATEDAAELAPLWPVSADVPTSYFYAGSFFRRDWWEALASAPDSACLACWLHGKAIATRYPTPFFTGRTVRLHLDGSVTTDRMAHFRWRRDGGFEVHFVNQFDPDGVMENRR